jgi:hypothetical protein
MKTLLISAALCTAFAASAGAETLKLVEVITSIERTETLKATWRLWWRAVTSPM